MMATSFSVGAASRVRAPTCVSSTSARTRVVSAAAAKTQAQQRQQARLGLTQRASNASGRSALFSNAAASPSVAPRGRSVAPVTTTARFSTNSYGDRGGGGNVPIQDRVVALLPYLVPLLDGLRYSRFFFQQFPQTIFMMAGSLTDFILVHFPAQPEPFCH
jgi:hypothetical protein